MFINAIKSIRSLEAGSCVLLLNKLTGKVTLVCLIKDTGFTHLGFIMKLWVAANAIRLEMSMVILECLTYLSVSVCPLTGQGKHPTANILGPQL